MTSIFYLVVGRKKNGELIYIEDPRTDVVVPLAFDTMENAQEGIGILLKHPEKPSGLVKFDVWVCRPTLEVDLGGKVYTPVPPEAATEEGPEVGKSEDLQPLQFCGSCQTRLSKATAKALRKAKPKKCGHGLVCAHRKCRACAILRGLRK